MDSVRLTHQGDILHAAGRIGVEEELFLRLICWLALGQWLLRLVMGEQVWCRYRDQLFLLAARELEPLVDQAQWHPGEMPELFLGPVHLQVGSDAAQWRIRSPDQPFTVRAAAGGERLFRNGMHQQVSELWRQAGIPPWQRRRLPLMLLGDEVVAAANIGVADNWQPESAEAGRGIQIEYQ